MSDNVRPWPKPAGVPLPCPHLVKRPCDYGLDLAVVDLETELGTIEAYNRLVLVAQALREQIDAGLAKPQNPIYAIDPRGAERP